MTIVLLVYKIFFFIFKKPKPIVNSGLKIAKDNNVS